MIDWERAFCVGECDDCKKQLCLLFETDLSPWQFIHDLDFKIWQPCDYYTLFLNLCWFGTAI